MQIYFQFYTTYALCRCGGFPPKVVASGKARRAFRKGFEDSDWWKFQLAAKWVRRQAIG